MKKRQEKDWFWQNSFSIFLKNAQIDQISTKIALNFTDYSNNNLTYPSIQLKKHMFQWCNLVFALRPQRNSAIHDLDQALHVFGQGAGESQCFTTHRMGKAEMRCM